MEDPNANDNLHYTHKWDEEEGFVDGCEEPEAKVPPSVLSSCPVGKLPSPGRFMNLQKVLTILRNTENVLQYLPLEEKNNVYYVVDDSKNCLKRENKLPSSYPDGCGPWVRCTSSYQYVDLEKEIKLLLKLRNGLFYKYCGDNTFSLITTQPDPNTLVKMYRYYSTQKGTADYRRRVTALSGNGITPRALVEYAGVVTAPCTNIKMPCKRRDSIVLGNVSQEVKHKSVKQVYEEMLKDSKHVIPKHIKQVSNVRYYAAKKMGKKFVSRVPNEKQVILTMLAESPGVQAVINRKDQPQCVILYSEEQLSDMKRNLECDSVLGVDCTHKFGDCYATMTVYQNFRALHKDTNEPLLFLGPVYLHWDKEFLTYVSFFSHIMDKLEGTEPNIEVRSGNEFMFSLFKAIKYCFPTSVHMLNCHYLKENVSRELCDALGGSEKECSIILKKIFGPDGLVNTYNLSGFQNRVLGLAAYIDAFPKFKTYFDSLQPLLYYYVCEPKQRSASQKLWANGSDKVLNDCLKVIAEHEPQELPELVENICIIGRLLMERVENVLYE